MNTANDFPLVEFRGPCRPCEDLCKHVPSEVSRHPVRYANGEFLQVHPTAIPGADKLRLMSESARGEEYAEFVGGRVVPFVRPSLPVAVDRSSTGVMGSSLGGLISLYLYRTQPETSGSSGR